MSKRVYITPAIHAAINAIIQAGHGVELEAGEGGNSHTVTFIYIGIRVPEGVGYVKKMCVKHVSSYGGKFQEFFGMSDQFGALCYSAEASIAPFLSMIETNLEMWLQEEAERERSEQQTTWCGQDI